MTRVEVETIPIPTVASDSDKTGEHEGFPSKMMRGSSHGTAIANCIAAGLHHNPLFGFDPLLTPSSVSTTTLQIMDLTELPSMPLLSVGGCAVETEQDPSQFASVDIVPAPPLGLLLTPSRFRKPTKEHRKTQSLSSWSPFRNKDGTGTGTITNAKSTRQRKDSSSLSPQMRPKETTEAGGFTPIAPLALAPAPPPTNPCTPPRIIAWSKRKEGTGYRLTKSAATTPSKIAPSTLSKRQSSVSANASPMVSVPHGQIAAQAPMVQDLLSIEQEFSVTDPHFLLLPSLAKPCSTSFLTGNEEVFLSSEQDPSAWQLEIPSYRDVLTSTRLCQFMETYRAEECLLDLQKLVSVPNLDLSRYARGDVKMKIPNTDMDFADCHRAIVESFLECGSDVLEVKGSFTSHNDHDGCPHIRREVLVVERQNKFLCVFRGTTAEQQGKFPKHTETVELPTRTKAAVFVDRYAALADLEVATFQLLDMLAEENPFCDIAFTGHSFGAAMATLAAYKYASTRTALRVACCVSASPKVGSTDFRMAVHSTPNLNIWHLEFARLNPSSCVGHHIRFMAPSKHNASPVVEAYKFGGAIQELSRGGGAATVLSFFSSTKYKEKDINEYVSFLESIDSSGWINSFYMEDGEGVRGRDNEARQMT